MRGHDATRGARAARESVKKREGTMEIAQMGLPLVGSGSRVAVQCSLAAAAVAFVYATWPQDSPPWLVLALLVSSSPLVGDFAMTMAARYRTGMDLAACFERLVRPSSCDSCARPLSQVDMVPFLSHSFVTGRCACGAYQVPRTYAAWSALALAGSLALVLAGWLSGNLPAAAWAVALTLSFMAAFANDVAHGEVDLAILLPPSVLAALAVAAAPSPPLTVAVMVASAALLVAAGFLGRFAGGGAGRFFPVGLVDVAAAFLCGSILDVRGFVNFSVLLVATMAVAAVAARIWGRKGLYGPDGSRGAFPAMPPIVWAAALAPFANFA